MRVGSEDLEKRVEIRFHRNGEKEAYTGIRVSSSQAISRERASERKVDKINTTRYDGNLIKLQTKQVKCYKFDDIIEMKI